MDCKALSIQPNFWNFYWSNGTGKEYLEITCSLSTGKPAGFYELCRKSVSFGLSSGLLFLFNLLVPVLSFIDLFAN